MKALKLIPVVLLMASCAKEELSNNPVVETPAGNQTSYQYYDLNVTDQAQVQATIGGEEVIMVDEQGGVLNNARISYQGNNATLGTEFSSPQAKLIINKRTIAKNLVSDSTAVKDFFSNGSYSLSSADGLNGFTITYIDAQGRVWKNGSDASKARFAIKQTRADFTKPCTVGMYEIKAVVNFGLPVYNNGQEMIISGTAVAKFAVTM